MLKELIIKLFNDSTRINFKDYFYWKKRQQLLSEESGLDYRWWKLLSVKLNKRFERIIKYLCVYGGWKTKEHKNNKYYRKHK